MTPRLPSLAIARDGADFTRRKMEDKTERGISRVSFSEEAMSKDTKGDGSCGYKAVWQAEQQASIPIADRVGAPVDIMYEVLYDQYCRGEQR